MEDYDLFFLVGIVLFAVGLLMFIYATKEARGLKSAIDRKVKK